MRILIGVDGRENALRAVRFAARIFCTDNGETTLLFVRRYRKETRGYNIRRKATEVFSDWGKELPEIKYLHEAEDLLRRVAECDTGKGKTDVGERVLIHLGEGIFAEGKVSLPSESGVRLKIREGYPPEEIHREAEEGHYELVMLGSHSTGGCHWYDISHIPLEVARKAPCSVMVISRAFEEGQPVLVCVGEKALPEETSGLIQVIATRMKSRIEVLAVHTTKDATSWPSEKTASMVEKWREHSLNVVPQVLIGNPVKVIPDMAAHCGLIVCLPSEKKKSNRLGKVPKKVLCSSQFNLLVSR